jgi:hypothetical protein
MHKNFSNMIDTIWFKQKMFRENNSYYTRMLSQLTVRAHSHLHGM